MKVKRTNFDGSWEDICVFCNEKQEKHKCIAGELNGVRYEHRMPCEPEKRAIVRKSCLEARTFKTFIFFGWIIIPISITVMGFANFWIGLLLFFISIFKVGWTAIELYGTPEEWFPGYKSKAEKKFKLKHYYYHCEKNPEGFNKILLENFAAEENEKRGQISA